MQSYNKQKGFSLIELMVVVAIIGILASIIVPNYSQNVQRAARSDGMGTLLDLMRAQENYFANEFSYTDDFRELGYDKEGYMLTDSGDYKITASKCDADTELTSCVLLTATGQGSQSEDGDLTLSSRGEKTHDGNDGWAK